MRRLSLSILFIMLLSFLKAQMITNISHYSVDNGLSENHILCMLQDRKGIMWFGTYDGINKFDGYSFRNFKGSKNQKYKLINCRIDRLKEDKQGFLWIQTNDGRVYRFNSSTETFLPVPQCIPEYKNFNTPINRINVLSDGSVWLYNSDSNNEGCFKVENTLGNQQLILTHFAKNKGDFQSNKINKIYLDKNMNTWILTSKGISYLKRGNSRPIQQFTEKKGGQIFSICENPLEFFIGGEQGKLRVFNKKKGTLELIETPIKSDIIDIEQITSQEVLLLTKTSDFYTYNFITRLFQNFRLTNVKSNQVSGCFKDRGNNVWIDADVQGAIMFDTKTKSINYLPVKTSKYVNATTHIFYVVEDKYDNIWVQTRTAGFYKYNKDLKRLDRIPVPNTEKESISGIVHTAISDRQGNLWLSTYMQGVDKIVFTQSPFVFTRPYNAPLYTLTNEIRSIFQDSRNWLWVGLKNGAVYVYNNKRELKGLFGYDGRINGKNPFNIPVYDIMEDHSGTIWMGTKGMGLFRLNRKADDTFAVTNYQYDAKDIYSISSNSVYSIFEDHLHRIWIGTFWGGLNLLETKTNIARFISNRNKLKNYPISDCLKVRYITEDKQNLIYFCTTQGLLVCKSEPKNPEEIIFKRYTHNPDNQFSLSGNDVHYLLTSQKGDTYLAVIGGGINVVKGGFGANKEPKFEVLKNLDGTSSNLVYTLKEDKKGYIWMSAQTQIIKYNPKNSKTDTYKPVSANNYFFSEAAVSQTRQGEIIYGTSDGFVSFDPLKIHKSIFVPRISLTQLQIFNKPVQVNVEQSHLKEIIDNTRELVLDHTQNIFSLEYAALDYINPNGIQYAYKLEGLEKDWNFVGNQRIANYINLPKGKYVFHVKSTNADGEWVNNEKVLVIIKLPSFWESAWGLIFYFVVFVLLSGLTAYILFTIFKLRNEVDIEHRMTNMKLRFFTDISHELRTPLTLIASPVDNILKKELLSANVRDQLQVVQRNTNRMLRLINQILDFRKIQNKKMKLIIEVISIADFLEEINMSFKKLAEDRSIRLTITDHTHNTQLWVDKDKFEKIIINLLSNAFKFSPAENRIDIIITDNPESVTIAIQDHGIGISKDKLKLLFGRFESFATSSNIAFQASTGIGLSLTKELVELLQAKIDVESESGKGSAFKVTFMKGFEHFAKSEEFLLRDLEPVETNQDVKNELNMPGDIDVEIENEEMQVHELPKILIVEDNHELRSFLKSALAPNYEVYEAENGRMALDMALSFFPDMIISDIMMPDMDGLELARTIKGDLNISHIPFILLTAKTDIESKLEALELGVDDYITKPFSLDYLEARIENLLKIRCQLQVYFKSTLTSGIIILSKPDITNLDDSFIKKTMSYLEENYEDSTMNIDDIASFTGLSRSSFFKKTKSLTGLAPVDFIREFRIQKATQLIETGETNIGQLAFNVGINDVRFFRRYFKEKYGMNPSDYISKKSAKDPTC